MADPEIQGILKDPVMQSVLRDFQVCFEVQKDALSFILSQIPVNY